MKSFIHYLRTTFAKDLITREAIIQINTLSPNLTVSLLFIGSLYWSPPLSPLYWSSSLSLLVYWSSSLSSLSINRLIYHQVNRFYILHIPNPIARRWWMVRESRCQSWIKKDPIALFRPRTPIHLNPDQYPSIPYHPYMHDSSLIPLS